MSQPTSPPIAAPAREALWHGGVFAAALVTTLIAWWPSHAGWFLMDDYRWLSPPTAWEAFRWFSSTWGIGYAYRPLARVSFLADLYLFGWNPIGWHLHSLLLQALNVWLLFALIWTVTRARAAALAMAALFAVSPLSHENVAWISGRTFLLGGLFFLGSLILLARALQTGETPRGRRLLFAGLLLFCAGLGSYEPVVVLPIVVLTTLLAFPHLAFPTVAGPTLGAPTVATPTPAAPTLAAPALATSPLAGPTLAGATLAEAAPAGPDSAEPKRTDPPMHSPWTPMARRMLAWLFGIVPFFVLGRLLVLKGGLGVTTPLSSWWFYAPVQFYWVHYIHPHWTPRVLTPALLALAALATLALGRLRPALLPAGAMRMQGYLVLTAFVLFLPFASVTGVADRFLYLVQLAFIGTIVLLGLLIARSSREGAVAAAGGCALLVCAGLAESRTAAREWAEAGRINLAIADTLHAQTPVWPAGTDLEIAGLAHNVGRAPIYVLFARESVLQRYLYTPQAGPHSRPPTELDAEVRLTYEPPPSADTANVADATGPATDAGRERPTRYFTFDRETFRLTETVRPDRIEVHGPAAAR